jgi:hypothetical protein
MRKLLAGWLLGILALSLLGLGMAWLGLLPSHATAPPPAWEKAIAQMALERYVARHAPRVANPIAATTGLSIVLDHQERHPLSRHVRVGPAMGQQPSYLGRSYLEGRIVPEPAGHIAAGS